MAELAAPPGPLHPEPPTGRSPHPACTLLPDPRHHGASSSAPGWLDSLTAPSRAAQTPPGSPRPWPAHVYFTPNGAGVLPPLEQEPGEQGLCPLCPLLRPPSRTVAHPGSQCPSGQRCTEQTPRTPAGERPPSLHSASRAHTLGGHGHRGARLTPGRVDAAHASCPAPLHLQRPWAAPPRQPATPCPS